MPQADAVAYTAHGVEATAKANAMLRQLLGSALRAKLLGWLFGHPGERYFVRQLASLLGEDSTNLSRELARLAKAGVLICRPEGRQKYYQVNPDCPVFGDLRGLVLKTAGLVDVLRDALAGLAGKIEAAFVYGSQARGDSTALSDVDLMVIGPASFGQVVSALGPAQEALGRAVNPTVYPEEEFRAKLRGGHPFLTDVMRRPKLLVIGDEDDLRRLAAQRLGDEAGARRGRDPGAPGRGGP